MNQKFYERERERVKSKLGFTPTLYNKCRGFTLIELLVVISIIGFLATASMVVFNNVRMKARDTARASDIKQVQLAVEMYYDINGSYPLAAAWYGGAGNCWGTVTDNWVPGLVPTYMAKLPLDPKPTNCSSVYLYASNGVDYKILAHVPENCENPAYSSIKDPARDGGSNPFIVDGNNCWAWSFYSPGYANQ